MRNALIKNYLRKYASQANKVPETAQYRKYAAVQKDIQYGKYASAKAYADEQYRKYAAAQAYADAQYRKYAAFPLLPLLALGGGAAYMGLHGDGFKGLGGKLKRGLGNRWNQLKNLVTGTANDVFVKTPKTIGRGLAYNARQNTANMLRGASNALSDAGDYVGGKLINSGKYMEDKSNKIRSWGHHRAADIDPRSGKNIPAENPVKTQLPLHKQDPYNDSYFGAGIGRAQDWINKQVGMDDNFMTRNVAKPLAQAGGAIASGLDSAYEGVGDALGWLGRRVGL